MITTMRLIFIIISLLIFLPAEVKADSYLVKRNNEQDKALVLPTLANMQVGTAAKKTAAYWNNLCLIADALNSLDGGTEINRNDLKGGNKMLAVGSKPISKVIKWINELPKDQIDSDAAEISKKIIVVYSAVAKHFSYNDGGMSDGEVALDGLKAGAKTFFSGGNPFSVFLDSFNAWPNLVKELESLQDQSNQTRMALEVRFATEGIKLNKLNIY